MSASPELLQQLGLILSSVDENIAELRNLEKTSLAAGLLGKAREAATSRRELEKQKAEIISKLGGLGHSLPTSSAKDPAPSPAPAAAKTVPLVATPHLSQPAARGKDGRSPPAAVVAATAAVDEGSSSTHCDDRSDTHDRPDFQFTHCASSGGLKLTIHLPAVGAGADSGVADMELGVEDCSTRQGLTSSRLVFKIPSRHCSLRVRLPGTLDDALVARDPQVKFSRKRQTVTASLPTRPLSPHAAAASVAQQLSGRGFAVVDGFLPSGQAAALLGEARRQHDEGSLLPGALDDRNRSDRPGFRNDLARFVPGEEARPSLAAHTAATDSLVMAVQSILAEQQERQNVGGGDGKEETSPGGYDLASVPIVRGHAMVACYPGNGARYARHCDNENGNGRVLTVILYLNDLWDDDRVGGRLRIWPSQSDPSSSQLSQEEEEDPAGVTHCKQEGGGVGGGGEGGGYCVDIDPLYNRLIAFYSDKRNPHEVMPSHSLRFAVTTWYFDETAVKTMAV